MLMTRRTMLWNSGVIGTLPLFQTLETKSAFAGQATSAGTPTVPRFHAALAKHVNEGAGNVLQALHNGSGRAAALYDHSGRLRLFSQHLRALGVDDLHRKLLAAAGYDALDVNWATPDDEAISGIQRVAPGLQKQDIPYCPPPTAAQFEIAKQRVLTTGLSGHFLNVADVLHRSAIFFDLQNSAELSLPEQGVITPAAYDATTSARLVLICDAQQKQKTKKAKAKMLCDLVTYLKYASWTAATIRLAVCGADALISLGLDIATEGAASLLTAEEAALCVALGSAAVRNTNYILTTLGFAVC